MKEIEGNSEINALKYWLPSIFIFLLAFYWSISRGTYTLIDTADLVIHEGGHLFFFIFGRFIYMAGGTLMQMLLPSLIAFYFFWNSYKTGVQFSLLWLGQNFINISVYAADARAHKLHLLGGNRVQHDWTYLLNTLGIIEYDQEIGYFFFAAGIIIFLLAVLLPAWWKQISIA